MATTREDILKRLRTSTLKAEAEATATPEQLGMTHKPDARAAVLSRLSADPVDTALETRQEAAQAALPGATFQVDGREEFTPDLPAQAAIDVGFGMTRIPEGIKQMQLQSNVNRLEKIVRGEPTTYSVGMGEEADFSTPTLAERKEAEIQLDTARKNLIDYEAEKSREVSTYQMGTEGRQVRALVGQMAGAVAGAPIPGVGQRQAGTGILNTLRSLSGRASTEGALSASLSGLEFVPEGLDKNDQMLMSLLFGGALRGGMDTLSSPMRGLLGRMRGRQMTPEEAQEILAIARADHPEMDENARMMTRLFDPEFQNTQLRRVFSEEEIANLPDVMRERLSVFAFMDTEPTRGQVFRDPQMMKEELQIAGTRAGDDLDVRFREQRDAGERRLLEITGRGETHLGTDVRNAFDMVSEEWEGEWSQLYRQAAENTNPDQRFNINSLAAAIINNRNNLSINDAQKSLASIKNVNDMLQQRMDIPDADMTRLRRGFQAQHGEEAMIEMAIMDQLVRRQGGINAIEGDEILKTFNRIKSPTPTDRQIIREMREGLLADTIDGAGVDAFRQARDSFSEFYTVIENYPIARRLGLDHAARGQLSEQDIMAKLVLPGGKIEDFRDFMALLEQPRFRQVAEPLRESMRHAIFANLREKSLVGPIKAGVHSNEPSFSAKQFIKALDNLSSKGGRERLDVLLTDQERAALGTIKRYGQFLDEPAVMLTKQQPSGTAIQTLAGAITFLNRNPMMRGLSRGIAAINEPIAEAIERAGHRRRTEGFGVPELIQQAEGVVSPQPTWFDQMMMETRATLPPAGVRTIQREEDNNYEARIAEEIARNRAQTR